MVKNLCDTHWPHLMFMDESIVSFLFSGKGHGCVDKVTNHGNIVHGTVL